MLGGVGRKLVPEGGGGIDDGRAGGRGNWLGRSALRTGGGGGVPNGRGPPGTELGRGGWDAGRGTGGRGATSAGSLAGSAARFPLSLADPRSSPMAASAVAWSAA